MSHGVCFSAPELDAVSWGITAVSLGTPATTGTTQPLFVTAYGSSEVVQLQMGNSGFAELNRLTIDNPPWMAIGGDYNQDGIVDCLIASPGSASQSGALSLWRYPGSGSWSKVISQSVGLGTYAVAARGNAAAGEVFAVAASYTQQVIVPLITHGNGLPTAGSAISLNLQPTAAEFGIERSGVTRLFVVGTTDSTGKLVVFDLIGGQLSQSPSSYALSSSPNDIELADLNGDNLLDVVVVNDSEHSTLESLLGDSTGGWTLVTNMDLPAYSHAAALIDVNHDGHLDIATISGSAATIQVCFGDGKGGFTDCADAPHGLEQPTDIVAGDLDADGRADLISVGYEGVLSRLRVSPASSSSSTH